jgi:quinol monooxygenase YgiN
LIAVAAHAGDGGRGNGPPLRGPIFDIIHFDVIPLVEDGVDFEQTAYKALFAYRAASRNANGQRLLNFTVLRQLDRPNRFVTLEVWDNQADYAAWQDSAVTAAFVARTTPLLGSPFDHRLNILCRETYVDGTGCVPP